MRERQREKQKNSNMLSEISCYRRTAKLFSSRNVIPIYIRQCRSAVNFSQGHHSVGRPRYFSESHADSSMREFQNQSISPFYWKERNEWRVWVSKSCQMTISHPKRLKNTLQISPNCCYHYGLHCVCLTSSSMVSFHCRIRKKLISLLRLFKISFDLSFEPFLFIIFWMWSNVISIYPFVVFVGLKTFHKCVH